MPKRYLRRPDGTLVEYSGGSGGDISREEFNRLSKAIADKLDNTDEVKTEIAEIAAGLVDAALLNIIGTGEVTA